MVRGEEEKIYLMTIRDVGCRNMIIISEVAQDVNLNNNLQTQNAQKKWELARRLSVFFLKSRAEKMATDYCC